MNHILQRRLEQLINQGNDLLSKTITKQDALGIVRDFLDGDGPELFIQWKLSSRKLLKSISIEDYDSFLKAEKPIGYDNLPNILKRLIPILKASLDDLSLGVIDTNSFTVTQSPNNVYYNIDNLGSMANHNENSNINQISTNTLTIIKGDFNSLAANLRSHGIEENDIQELQTIIDVGPLPQSSNEYSTYLRDWMKKMIGRSIDGSWQVAVGAAGSILATGLQNYFGIFN